jgi:hypothetical protein
MAVRRKDGSEDVAELILKFLRTKRKAKELYDSADSQMAKLRRKMNRGGGIPLPADAEAGVPAGKKAVLINNWAGKTVVWGHGSSRKYDIDVIAAED